MNAKCKCVHCFQPIEFPEEMCGQNVKCPVCDEHTRLYIGDPPPPTPIVQAPLATPSAKPYEPAKIEERLESIATLFAVVGYISAVAIGFGFLVSFGDDDMSGLERIGLLCAAIGCALQGIILSTLFNALAEIIRLLRRNSK